MIRVNNIKDYLDYLFPNATCELYYTKDYELLIAVMLSAQTTDIRVNLVTRKLFNKFPSLEDIVKADLEDIIPIVRSLGSYNRKANAIKIISDRLLKEQNGKVPNDREFLESLLGVGRKTANVVLANLYNVPVIAVDTHVNRVSKRLGIANIDDDLLSVEKKLYENFDEKDIVKLHHQLVLFGRYHCKARSPNCASCKLINICIEKRKNL